MLFRSFVSGVGNNGEIDGFKFINKYFFIATTLSIIASTVLSIPLSFNFDIKLGYLKQLKLLDVNIFLFKLIDIIVSILIIYFEILILFFFSKFIYNLDITSINNVILSLLLLLPTIISYAFLFTIIALFLKKPENYMSIGITSMMILLAFSGCLGIDPNNFGGILTNIYKYIPSYYISIPLYDLWNNGTFPYIDYFIDRKSVV